MKRFKYLLAAITICLLASCGNSSSMQGYVTEKMAEYSRTCVKFNRLTTSEDILDLSKCHPLAYYRTLTPPNVYGDIRECVAIKYKEGVLYAVSGSGAMYFWDNEMLTSKAVSSQPLQRKTIIGFRRLLPAAKSQTITVLRRELTPNVPVSV